MTRAQKLQSPKTSFIWDTFKNGYNNKKQKLKIYFIVKHIHEKLFLLYQEQYHRQKLTKAIKNVKI